MSKSHDRPKRQKRRPKEFRQLADLPEPRELAKPDAPTDEEIAVLVMMKGPNWREKT